MTVATHDESRYQGECFVVSSLKLDISLSLSIFLYLAIFAPLSSPTKLPLSLSSSFRLPSPQLQDSITVCFPL